MEKKREKRKPFQFEALMVAIVYWLAKVIHHWTTVIILWIAKGLNFVVQFFPWSSRLAFIAAMCGIICINFKYFGRILFIDSIDMDEKGIALFNSLQILSGLAIVEYLALGIGFLLIFTSFVAFIRSKLSLWLLKIAAAAFAVLWGWVLVYIVQIPQAMFLKNSELVDVSQRNDLWLYWFFIWILVFLLGCVFLLCTLLRSVKLLYSGTQEDDNLLGDNVFNSIKTGGKDPEFRSSSYWSAFLHLFFIVLLPLILRECGMMEGYKVPKGDGVVAQMVKIKRIKKKKPKEQFVFNPNSAISYFVPKLNDKRSEELDKMTEQEYRPTSMGKKSNKGDGKPGWPNGMEGAKIRFIRLKYAGGDWDQDMGKGADYNILLFVRKITGFTIAKNTEAIEVRDLKRFPKKQTPPFVYMTGKRGIRLDNRSIKILRWYLLEEGGMLFADNGGGYFNSSFRALMRRVLPNKKWVDIANDDILYQQPFTFPRGAPPLWHHSGTRAMGMKHNGRWVVFYHQGDINDAWKEGGSGASEAVRAAAFKMGTNVINYSFTQYLSIHYGD